MLCNKRGLNDGFLKAMMTTMVTKSLMRRKTTMRMALSTKVRMPQVNLFSKDQNLRGHWWRWRWSPWRLWGRRWWWCEQRGGRGRRRRWIQRRRWEGRGGRSGGQWRVVTYFIVIQRVNKLVWYKIIAVPIYPVVWRVAVISTSPQLWKYCQ